MDSRVVVLLRLLSYVLLLVVMILLLICIIMRGYDTCLDSKGMSVVLAAMLYQNTRLGIEDTVLSNRILKEGLDPVAMLQYRVLGLEL